jgi:hypothetical protein
MSRTTHYDTCDSTRKAKPDNTPDAPVPRDILSFRAAEPINQMIKLEARRRKVTVTRVIADAVALALGRKYPSRLMAWRGMVVAEERTKRRLARAARAARAVLLSKARGVDAGQIPAMTTRGDQIVEHSVFDVPGGETTTSMLKSPALPVAAQPGSTLEGP